MRVEVPHPHVGHVSRPLPFASQSQGRACQSGGAGVVVEERGGGREVAGGSDHRECIIHIFRDHAYHLIRRGDWRGCDCEYDGRTKTSCGPIGPVGPVGEAPDPELCVESLRWGRGSMVTGPGGIERGAASQGRAGGSSPPRLPNCASPCSDDSFTRCLDAAVPTVRP